MVFIALGSEVKKGCLKSGFTKKKKKIAKYRAVHVKETPIANKMLSSRSERILDMGSIAEQRPNYKVKN